MKSDLHRYELDYSDRKENKIASGLIAVAWTIAICGVLGALYMLMRNAYSAFWTTLIVSLVVCAFLRGMAEIIRLLQAILAKLKV
ncbi:hypothetical protein GZH47_17495 [Paenibacillus rhizovicinus]|uniref:DUF4282 domain-containing protein n=1 Tax=Paenibacillus rhizovicinus TaxID=2704463 RepID=A0A6C0P2D9_9BACL|nr:hypothetical protein [Paenibacillus rhizovicinus]QHW32426.1 hypothetical protein GZH47_17495 [Paenibacillus rhizovicinus]